MTNFSAVIYFSAGLLASDYFQTDLKVDEADKLYEIRRMIHAKISERIIQQSSFKVSNAEIGSVCIFVKAYACYFNNVFESEGNVSFIDKSLQSSPNDFFNLIIDGFFEVPEKWRTYYHMGILSGLKYQSEQSAYPFRFLKSRALYSVSQKAIAIKTAILNIPKDDRDSICQYATQTAVDYRNSADLPDFGYMVKRIAEIPPEHRHIVLRESRLYLDRNSTQKWLRIIRQANESEYYASLMYKIIPFLDQQSFWSIFADYSKAVPTEEHLNYAFELFSERITGAYFLPRSREATEALRLYLSPWFPVALVCKIRSCKALEPCR